LKAQAGPVSIDCLASLLRGNHFASVNFAIDTLDTAQIDEALDAVRQATLHVHEKYQVMLDKIDE